MWADMDLMMPSLSAARYAPGEWAWKAALVSNLLASEITRLGGHFRGVRLRLGM